MKTMQAVRVLAYGGIENLALEEVPRPEIADDEMLVRVHAAGVNPVDWKVREGYMREFLPFHPPYIPGYDLSGVVVEAGAAVKEFTPGDEVFAMLELGRPGAWSEYAAVKAVRAARKPKNLDHAQAGGVPLAALTAWQCLFEVAGLQPRQKVLIHAAAGGVGHFAVQFARWAGAHVIGTASPANHDFLRRIGAHEAIDYHSGQFAHLTGELDVVLDLLSNAIRELSWPLLKKGGILVSTLPPEPPAEILEKYGVRGAAMLVRPDGLQLGEIGQLIEEGKVTPEVTSFPLASLHHTLQASQNGHTRGKLSLIVTD